MSQGHQGTPKASARGDACILLVSRSAARVQHPAARPLREPADCAHMTVEPAVYAHARPCRIPLSANLPRVAGNERRNQIGDDTSAEPHAERQRSNLETGQRLEKEETHLSPSHSHETREAGVWRDSICNQAVIIEMILASCVLAPSHARTLTSAWPPSGSACPKSQTQWSAASSLAPTL